MDAMDQTTVADQAGFAGCVRAFDALAQVHDHISDQLQRALQAEAGLSINEFRTMVAIAEKGMPSLSDLVVQQSMSQPAFSRLVSRLEQRGLVERQADEADARVCRVCLTDQGRRLLDRASTVHTNCLQENLFDRISDSERKVLREILLKIGPR